MTKSIIVIETPKCCLDCPCSLVEHKFDFCEISDTMLTTENMVECKPEWCTLKPIQRLRVPFNEFDEFALGWNACINMISGGK